MTQDMNHTIVKGLRAVLVAAMMSLTSSSAMAGVVVKGNVYGGGNLANVGQSVTVNVKAGQIGDSQIDANHGNVYGGGALANTNTDNWNSTTSTVTVTYHEVKLTVGTSLVGYYLKDGSNYTAYTEGTAAENTPYYKKTETIVNLTGGTVKGDVYGGGLGRQAKAAEGGNPAVEAVAAQVYGPVTVTVKNGTARNVFGCNNLNGAPQQEVVVNIDGGTINNDVYGGGNMADSPGSITVNVTGGTVNDVYGGGALASTNTANWDATNSKLLYFVVDGLTSGTSSVTGYYTLSNGVYTLITDKNAKAVSGETYYTLYTTTVNLTGGIIANAYGGGLGDATTPAYVYGDVKVNVNGTAFTQTNESYVNGDGSSIPKTGRVFGCNNINGSPKSNVTVHVFKTVGLNEEGTINNTKPDNSSVTDPESRKYELAAVYGGGNLAPYEPVKAGTESTADTDDSYDDTIASTEVIVDGCTLTSIKQVYGGGNAASTPATKVTINGSYEIEEVFGGGNGKDKISSETGNPGAHVGFKAYTTDEEKATSKYGYGVARVNIDGGIIHSVYGGSNTKGNVRKVAVAMLDQTSEEDCFEVDEAYGGGKSAEMDGKAILSLGCIPGVGSVYGGARAASVNNDVVLTITNGTYENVYGGNNETGTINGSITVNIEETGCRPIHIGNLYGGGNQAAYTTPSGKEGPTINVRSCTSINNVFGGGYGSTAVVTGDTHVNVNMVKGRWAGKSSWTGKTESEQAVPDALGTIGHVYGGGYGANVNGDTYVNIGTAATVDFVTEPAYLGEGKYTYDSEAKLYKGVAVVGANITGDVFGGGFGAETNVTGTAYVNIGEKVETTSGETTTVSYEAHDASATGNFAGNIYGGSALGTVNNTQVNLYAGTITTNVFGGGMGQLASGTQGQEGYVAAQSATITTKAEVKLYDANASAIYGGCNANGTAAATEVTLIGGTVGSTTTSANVFGGGFGHNTYVSGDVLVNVGESNQTTGGTTIYGDVYGGSAQGYVNAEMVTTTSGESTTTSLQYNSSNTTTVNLYKGIIYGDAYGGGLGQKDGFNGATSDVAAEVGGDVFVNVNGTAFKIAYETDDNNAQVVKSGRVFGCNNLYGSPKGNVTVTVDKTVGLDGSGQLKTTHTKGEYEIAAVYGGGNLANYEATGKKTNVIINGCNDTSIQYVYGGGNAAAVPETDVDVNAAYELGYVFGGGNGKDKYKKGTDWVSNPGANVNGNVNTMIYGGTIHEAYGGSNERGSISGSVAINSQSGGTCDLNVEKLYGAGKNADIDGDLIVVLGCMPGDANKTAEVYGGAENANVKGNVELTITSGSFGKVFGGNNQSGAIFGHIILNIDESGCTPIKIDELYLGGNQAAYSVYGYFKAKKIVDGDKLFLDAGKTIPLYTDGGNFYKDEAKNIPLYIDDNDFLYLDQEKTKPLYLPRKSASDANTIVTFTGKPNTVPNTATGQYDDPVLNIISATSIGKVFGGGLGAGATLYGNPMVNINQAQPLAFSSYSSETGTAYTEKTGDLGAIGGGYTGENSTLVEGGVFGGGNEAAVFGNTTVNIGNETTVDRTVLKLDADQKPIINATTGKAETQTISAATVRGANITGNVYGGGNLADVSGNTQVNICAVKDATDETKYNSVAEGASKVIIAGDVFGAGKGSDTDVMSALVKENSFVYMGGGTVKRSIYGGGQLASVGDYTYTDGKPTAINNLNATTGEAPTGTATVNIFSGTVGPDAMPATLLTGYTGTDLEKDLFIGHVFGAGKGMTGDASTTPILPKLNYVNKTVVIINGTVNTSTNKTSTFIKGSVYGGSQNGHVLGNTNVTVNGGQIGCGAGQTEPYTEMQFLTWGNVITNKAGVTTETSLAECPSWTYGQATDAAKKFQPYDKYTNTKGDDGHTYYGNVFGGGSGYFPYASGKWSMTAGAVFGNTNVTINGGHILTSVYGGNEMTNVGKEGDANTGKCTVSFGGTATLGVPRTLTQIDAHPVTGYLFGAGKGDQRPIFNTKTNVNSVEVNVTGGWIYGSVYGGGEDGHVLNGVTMTISDEAKIGTWGTSYVDGNVFGAGRGFGGETYTAGNVGGNITMNISGGTMLGSVYGGGRLGSVGYDLKESNDTDYGKMSAEDTRGHVDINITGGTIGNDWEFANVDPTTTPADLATWKSNNHVPNTEYELYETITEGSTSSYIYRLKHTKGGNVFAGGMGRRFKLDGTTEINETTDGIDWKKLGNVKSTTLTISQADESVPTIIKSNVYGGGELGALTGSHTTDSKAWGAEISITGGTIGTAIGSDENKYFFGSVYGGGMGNETYGGGDAASNTNVNMTGGKVKASVYGGGEIAVVEGNTDVTIGGGEIGHTKDGDKQYGGATMGNVYGGGKGSLTKWDAGLIKGNTKVTINNGTIYHNIYGGGAYGSVGTITTGSATYVPGISSVSNMPISWTRKTGDTGTDTGSAEVYVYGGTIGVDGKENGMVFASSRGDVSDPGADGVDPNNRLAWVYDTKLVIGGEGKNPTIYGSAYGSGENGHVFTNTNVEIHNGIIGINDDTEVTYYSDSPTNSVVSFKGKAYDYRLRGNVYGCGCGEDTYPTSGGFNPLAGIVLGNANVTIDGGQVVHNVYGGGALGSAGGKTTVTISDNAIIGVDGGTGGSVFGASRGKEGVTIVGSNLANSLETEVKIQGHSTDNTKSGAQIWGSVYGGGEAGNVKQNVKVSITGGVVAKDVYGGGALADTQTSNWNTTTNTWATGKVTDGKTTYKTTVNLLGGMIKGDAYGGGLGRLEVKSGETVTTTGIEAKVYGDVNVNLGSSESGSSATAFWIDHYEDNSETTINESTIVKSGRVFGCNNLNGSPQGNVTVTVWKTVAGSNTRTPAGTDGKAPMTVSSDTDYEVAAVYGGGNLANYTATDKKTHVVINGCNDTSIEYVYGGGNAAAVGETDVDINAAYEIAYVFGGGNGKDPYTLDGTTWNDNPGANVIGDANTVLAGGTIHEAFGGSNEKGTISGSVSITTDTNPDCALRLGKLYGAGKNADIEGDLIVTLGCMPGDESPTDEVYGGAENANVKGNVELTITSGSFRKVFGGNNTSGAIFGHIKLNIEETGCRPIKIDELYLGGYNAPYSVYGYYEDGTIQGTDKPKYVAIQSASDNTHTAVYFGDGTSNDHTKAPYTDPELNIISCTRIGKVFGGGLGSTAVIYGNPTVNINQIYGIKADGNGGYTAKATTLGEIGGQYTLNGETVDGGVFGGGNQAPVIGNTTLNIGTLTEVKPLTAPVGQTAKDNGKFDVLGANIVSNVYGGGNLADVGDTELGTDTDGSTIDVIHVASNTNVNIGAKYNTTTDKWESVAEGTSKVLIAGNVFGGGKGDAADSGDGAFRCGKAMVTGGTNIHIGNGTINGTVYGGGEVGRVEGNSVVAIGIGEGVTSGTPTSAPEIKGDVFGAGKGKKTHGYSALMRGNPTVTIEGDAKVRGSVYGGGEIASVGRYNVKKENDPDAPADVLVGMPYTLAGSGSGYCTIIIQGNAEIGPETEMKMTGTTSGKPDDTGHVIGGGKGVLPYDGYGVTGDDWVGDPWRVSINDQKDIFNKSNATYTTNYEKEYFKYIETLALATETNVTISGNALVKGSVYGGSLNGHVQHDTHVNIEGGQIGQGEGKTGRYSTADWTSASLAECPHWDFDASSGAPYDPLATTSGTYDYAKYGFVPEADRIAKSEGGLPEAKDGHTYYGNVFGGGSGVIPYAPGKWHRGAGSVGGDTYVNITGGHILTSVYGGNEQTDVGTYTKDASGQPTTTPAATNARGKCTINMTGGTVGVPRTDAEKQDHPVVGNVFGAGKGDQRIFFNTWTNVINTEVNISGDARVYGSVFGGGEDGHIIGDAVTNIGNVTTKTGKDANGDEITASATASGLIIGTTGTSYFDGHVFGGGRGFSGEAQTAGNVGGNVRLTINAGSVYGSVYGGGRLASVGTMFEFPKLDNGDPNPAYGQFKEDETGANAKTYGHVTINISGGTIGKDYSTTTPLPDGLEHSGNVFGGSMGRLELLNGTRNPIWPKMAQVKSATVTISGDNTVIRRNVYGGGELGTVRDDASVTISGGTIRRDVYGGGYGSEDMTHTVFSVYEPKEGVTTPSSPSDYEPHTYAYTPMQFAGCVGKSTTVNVSGGYIRKSVYGGGEMASVGVIDYRAAELASGTSKAGKVWFHDDASNKDYYYTNMVKHDDVNTQFALSWPYKFEYVTGFEGATHVNITGGRLGLKTDDTDKGFEDNGDVYGAGKGKAGDFKDYLFCANVGSTDVKIEYPSTPDAYSGTADLIAGAVYGGGEDGHVMGDAKVTMKKGFVYHSLYGAGSGKGTYDGSLLKIGATEASATTNDYYSRKVYSITAGKVFGNTEVVMEGGTVVRNVYGGGNMGSVGKGNYAGGSDDYSTDGYGENAGGNLWSNTDFTGSGKCTVTITGGTIGFIDTTDPSNTMYPYNSPAGLPYGNVFGGCRGEAAPDLDVTPSYLYSPEFFMGYVNETSVEIGKADGTGPTILGSVYGGGMDGHVRRDASVTVKGGEIGKTFDATSSLGNDPDNIQWLARGNVYGAGSGIGEYNASNIQYLDTYSGTKVTGTGKSTSAGSVTRFTKVDIQGGTIHRNVYGGGSLASVGAPKIDQSYNEYRKGDTAEGHGVGKQTINEVVISGGKIGDDNSYANGVHVYGGHVFGGSRGDASLDATKFSTSMFTSVSINANADDTKSPVIAGSVFGGGEVGIVKGSVDVTMNGGTVNDDIYGGGALANTNTGNATNYGTDTETITSTSTYTTTVNLLGGLIRGDAYGGGLGQKDGFNSATSDIAAVVYGDIKVNLGSSTSGSSATAFQTSYFTGEHVDVVKSGRVFGCNNLMGSPKGNVTVDVWKTVTGKDGSDNVLKRTTEEAKTDNKTIKENNPDTYESVAGYVAPTYEVAAVYGGGNLADYTTAGKKAYVRIETCDVSIRDVYGGGNAAEVPETDVLVRGAYEIQEVFGGGNGKDPNTTDGGTTWEPNPGANIGNLETPGNATTLLTGGFVHEAYGGSNEKGTVFGSVSIDMGVGSSADNTNGACTLDVEKLVGAGKNADVNGDLIMIMGCKPSTKTPLLYAGADNANVNGDVELTITSGRYGKVFGGNNMGGIILGHIKLNIEETGDCDTPIEIDELYLGGNEAMYSQYGYYKDGNTFKGRTAEMAAITDPSATGYQAALTNEDYGTTIRKTAPYAAPELNVISATYIGKIFGGGYGNGAALYGNSTVNINMIPGSKSSVVPTFMTTDPRLTALKLKAADNPNKLGIIGDVYGGGNAADVYGNTTVNIGMETTVQCHESLKSDGVTYNMSDAQNVLGAYITGNVFGGGNEAEVSGNTYVNICGTQNPVLDSQNNPVVDSDGKPTYTDTSVSHSGTFAVSIGNSVYGGGNAADVLGNTFVTMADGYVFNGIFGGGLAGSVGTYTRDKSVTVFGHAANHDGCIGKPTECTSGGTCYVVVSGGQIGPVEVATQGMNRLDADGGPVPQGWVWGGGCGLVEDPATHPDTHFKAYVNNTDVTIKDKAFILESIIGGGEFGRVLGNTLVKIKGGQIGVGEGMVKNGKPVRYNDDDFIDPTDTNNPITDDNALAACSHFKFEAPYKTYDPYADSYKAANDNDSELYPGGVTDGASDGKTWIGCVFAGGSGYMPVVKAKDVNNRVTDYEWISSAGWVEGDAEVRISGGHILTNVYGGNEITSVKGKSTVTMTGGTIGVPRTKDQVLANPMTGNLFGAGKGDPRSAFDTFTNVQTVEVNVSGGIIYGSVYGGSENGHVLGNAAVNISGGAKIGTWGASYIDGNVYGGGMGSTENVAAGIIKGNTNVTIENSTVGEYTVSPTVLHNVYGGGAYGSVGTFTYDDNNVISGYTSGGKATISITGGTIGTTGKENGMVFGSSRGDVGAPGEIHDKLAWVYDTEVNIGTSGQGTTLTTPLIKGSVYGSGENGHTYHDAEVIIHSGTIGIPEDGPIISNNGTPDNESDDITYVGAAYPYRGNVYGGGCGTDKYYSDRTKEKNDGNGDTYNPLAGVVYGDATVTIDGGQVVRNVYGAGAMGSVGIKKTDGTISGGQTTINISGGTIGVSGTDGDGNVFGAARGDVDATSNEYALVRKGTSVSISGDASVKGNVYGGGELGCVGTYLITDGMRTFTWQDTDGKTNTAANSNNKKTGITNVTITGGTIGTGVTMSTDGTYANGNVFGAGKGKEDTFWCEKGIVYQANVNVAAGTVKGNVYGGGEVGRVETDAIVAIGTSGETEEGNKPDIKGNVFGGGAGVKTHGYSALVRGNTYVTAQGKAKVEHNIYGGGQIAAVGKYYLVDAAYKQAHPESSLEIGMPYSLVSDELGICNVTVIGSAAITGSVFGGGKGKEPENYTFADNANRPKRMMSYNTALFTEDNKSIWEFADANEKYVWEYFDTKSKYETFLETLGLTTQSRVTIGGTRDATTGTVTSSGSPTINGNVYGGSESGFVQHNTDVTIAGGTIGTTTAGGNVFGGGLGLATFAEAGRVRGNATVTVNGGAVKGNIYGGGSLGDVGTINKTLANYNYKWTDDAVNSTDAADKTYSYNNTGVCTVTINGGTIGTGVDPNTDGTYANGNVFGAGKGLEDTWWCEKAMAYKTNVTITDGTINGTVYGGGQVGRVENDATVTIGTEDETGTGSKPNIIGNVFGAGAGLKTHGYSALVRGDAYVTVQGIAQVGKSVYGGGEIASVGKFTVVGGLPKHPDSGGTCTVNIQDHAKIGANGTGHNVFGACKGVTPVYVASGENRSKSMQLATNAPKDASLWSYYPDDHTYIWRYYATEADYRDFLETLALTSHPIVTIAEDAEVNGSVFGGGERGVTLGSVEVNMNGGMVTEDVYGGGALANTNKGNWEDSEYVEVTGLPVGHTLTDLYTRTGGSGTDTDPYTYTAVASNATATSGETYYSRGNWASGKYAATTHATTYKTDVILTGGTIKGNVYGGGLGQIARAASAGSPAQGTEGEEGYVPAVPAVTKLDEVKAKVYGDVLVTLNRTKKAVTSGEGAAATTTYTYASDGTCVVQGNIFGCNNQNGSPQSAVTVHVYKTQGWEGHTGTTSEKLNSEVVADHSYHVKGVYGGGNLSAFYPDLKATRDTVQANVIIDGCKQTSIKQVYGGGNAASTPATNITINATYEIEEVFGGGNGLDDIIIHGETKTNPGANVGYEGYPTDYDIPASSKEVRTQKFSYGSGKASVTIYDGLIHRVFGGSNNKGNVRESAVTLLDDMSGCDFQVDEAYGGGKNAPMDAEAKLLMACIPGLKVAYGGAQEADVLGGVTLTITNGTYERVFGGNNISGTIQGPIVVNIEETGCKPIVIGELYGGGNLAGYSVYGYESDRKPKESGTKLYDDPVVNVKSFTSIGNIFGGGYGSSAKMVGNPTVNINVAKGKYAETYNKKDNVIGDNARVVGSNLTTNTSAAGYSSGYPIPSHAKGDIGAINNVFGGGNAAPVIGNPNVNIGTRMGEDEYIAVVEVATIAVTTADGYYTRSGEGTDASPYVYTAFTGTPAAGTTYYKKCEILGADIRGNVYGGGNEAEVTGNTNVVIGKEAKSVSSTTSESTTEPEQNPSQEP